MPKRTYNTRGSVRSSSEPSVDKKSIEDSFDVSEPSPVSMQVERSDFEKDSECQSSISYNKIWLSSNQEG